MKTVYILVEVRIPDDAATGTVMPAIETIVVASREEGEDKAQSRQYPADLWYIAEIHDER